MKYNRNIEQFLSMGEWLIDKQIGLQKLAQYMQECQLASEGVPLNYHLQRQQSKGGIILEKSEHVTPLGELGHSDRPREKGAIGLIRFDGVMFPHYQASTLGSTDISDMLYRFYANENIDGIIIELDTGGGIGQAGEIVRNAISDRNKPILVYAHNMASAGQLGYGLSDEIVASNETSVFGSIGVMYQLNLKAIKKLKKNFVDVYSLKSPNKNEQHKAILEDDYSGLIKEATRLDESFMKRVKQDRQLKGDINHTLSGAVFRAKEARQRGLIDGIGTFGYAVARMRAHIKRNNK